MRGSKVLSWVVLGAITAAVVAMLGLVMYQQGISTQERDQQHAEIVALQAGLDEANARLEAGGEQPVPVPSVEPGLAAAVVPVAPTQDQILTAFDIWCDLESCHGSDGEDGEDAPPMTQKQIFEGFSEWCSTDPRCVGVPGIPGAAGADSTVPGPPGRPPTPQEVLDAVKVICADNACVGPAGKDGKDGKDGRTFVKTECHTTGDWIFTWEDGTATTVAGPCRVTQPEPSPTATTTKGR
jgi:hypothetical protein